MEPIQREEIERASRLLCRRVAATLVECMAAGDMTFSDVDAVLTRTPGWARRFVMRLADGIDGGGGMRGLGEFAFACGCELAFRCDPLPPTIGQEEGEAERAPVVGQFEIG